MRIGTVLVVLAACGGSITTVDGSKNTANLTQTDQNQLCNDVYDYVTANFNSSDAIKFACGSEAANQPNCQQAYNTCIAQSSTVDAGAITKGPLDCTAFNQAVAQCNTTVAEYTKCVQQELSAMKSIESQMPLCGQAALEAADLNAFSSLSSDCVTLLTSCQLTFGPSGSSGTSFDAGTD